MTQQMKSNVQINAFQGQQTPVHNERIAGSHIRRQYNNFASNGPPTEKFQYRSTYNKKHTQKFLPKSTVKQKFTKGQCNACKIYGRHVRDCRFIAPHLAM